MKIFREVGIWIEDGTITPEPGYVIVYNWDKATQPNDGYSDHIGFVEEVSGGNDYCY
ncbi:MULTISPECIES: CHAP domain-containing protein [unclassified Blautia]|uniref:CHAP domain-containing protein n=1 Tax=unclassified Blautia TaxID=2648079 RepID=UPI0018F551D6|nr:MULTISPECIES: CHAP domain-containing protein [unclassified Blautia]